MLIIDGISDATVALLLPHNSHSQWTPHWPFVASLAASKMRCMWSVCTIIIINSACFLSLVSFWPKIIVRHARTHTHAHRDSYRTAPEVSFTNQKRQREAARSRQIVENADRQPSRLLSAIYRALYGHHASQGTRQLLQIQLNMCADCTLYIVRFCSVLFCLGISINRSRLARLGQLDD